MDCMHQRKNARVGHGIGIEKMIIMQFRYVNNGNMKVEYLKGAVIIQV